MSDALVAAWPMPLSGDLTTNSSNRTGGFQYAMSRCTPRWRMLPRVIGSLGGWVAWLGGIASTAHRRSVIQGTRTSRSFGSISADAERCYGRCWAADEQPVAPA